MNWYICITRPQYSQFKEAWLVFGETFNKASRRLLGMNFLTSQLGCKTFTSPDDAIAFANAQGYQETNSFVDDD